jgi:hypothetical protein
MWYLSKTPSALNRENRRRLAAMVALILLALRLVAALFKAKSRLEAENAALASHSKSNQPRTPGLQEQLQEQCQALWASPAQLGLNRKSILGCDIRVASRQPGPACNLAF